MANKAKRTEHAGGKNGGGHRGKRADAKRESAKQRREVDRRESSTPHDPLVKSALPPSRAARVGPVRKRMRLVVHRERDKRGVTYGVTSPDAPGAYGIGKTRATAVRDFRGAAALLAEHDVAHRHPIEALLRASSIRSANCRAPHEVVFLAEGAMPYVADWDWLVVALREVLGVKLPASVRREVKTILAAPRSHQKLPPLPVVVSSGGRLSVHAIDLVRSCPPPRLSADDEIEPLGDVEVVEADGIPKWIDELSDGDDSLNDALTEAWVAKLKAHTVMLRCGGFPRACIDELEAAEAILEAISAGRVQRPQLAEKAARAAEKFDAVRSGLRRGACGKLTVEFDRETDGRWIAEVPELPGVMVYGGSRDDALAKVVVLVRAVLADQAEQSERDEPGAKIRNAPRSRTSKGR